VNVIRFPKDRPRDHVVIIRKKLSWDFALECHVLALTLVQLQSTSAQSAVCACATSTVGDFLLLINL